MSWWMTCATAGRRQALFRPLTAPAAKSFQPRSITWLADGPWASVPLPLVPASTYSTRLTRICRLIAGPPTSSGMF